MKNEDISCKYVDEIIFDLVFLFFFLKWKRFVLEWEWDWIELVELDYGKYVLWYKEVLFYFEMILGIKWLI